MKKLQGLIVLLTSKNLTTGGKKGMILISMEKIFGGSLFLARYRNYLFKNIFAKAVPKF
jgi:hypothetical protein